MKPMLFALISLLIIGSSFADEKKVVTASDCKEGERFLECGTCEPTCGNESPICTMQCREPMCACETGKVRNPEGKCVLPSQCAPYNSTAPEVSILPAPEKPTCAENEAVKACSGCEPTCDQPTPFCNKMCRPLNICECQPNFYRHNGTNKCVPSEECPEGSEARLRRASPGPIPQQKCSANEVLKQCSGCENQCGRPEIMCKMICNNIPKCECDHGFFRDNSTGKCVPQNECSNDAGKECGENEKMTQCSGCEANCDHLDRMCAEMCNMIPKCECAPGFARNAENRCVPLDQCPNSRNPRDNGTQTGGQQCKTNEVLTSCPGCEQTCTNKNPICIQSCRLGQECQCAQGFYRNSAGLCVTEAECDAANPPGSGSNSSCPRNEKFMQCGTCEASCSEHNPICTLECKPAGCYCPAGDGFVRGRKGHCIHKSLCKRRGGHKKNSTESGEDEEYNPCAATSCPVGSRCEKVQVQCIRAPCPPMARCVPNLTPVNPINNNASSAPCETIDCEAGKKCVVIMPRCLEGAKDCGPKGICVPVKDDNSTDASASAENPCALIDCPPLKRCIVVTPMCTNDTKDCKPKGVCTPATFSPVVENPPLPTRPTRDVNPCDTHKCPSGTRCKLNQVQCIRAPCPPIPECVPIGPLVQPIDPCATMMCTMDSTCIDGKCVPLAENRPTRSTDDLQISDPCATMRCAAGTKCERLTINCFVPPCPPQANCVPIDNNNSTDTQPLLTCDNMDCPPEKVCTMVQVNCIKAPCFPPSFPECVDRNQTDMFPNNKCATVKCTATTHCVDGQCVPKPSPVPLNIDRQTRSTDSVLEADPCATMRCANGMVCSKVLVNCLRTSKGCRPRGVCVPADANGNPVAPRPTREAQPEEDLCALIDCQSGKKCAVIMPDCIEGAKDCGPKAVCIPQDEEPAIAVLPPAKDDPIPEEPIIQNEFCMRARCAGGCIATGIKCNEDGSHCTYSGTCVGRDEDVSNLDVCANSTCPTNKSCEAEKVQCFTTPCPPIPRCVDNQRPKRDVCKDHKCPEGQECRPLQLRCNRLIKNCQSFPRCVDKKDKQ